MSAAGFQTRRAQPSDAPDITIAHRESIRSIGPAFYPPAVVAAWEEGLEADVYLRAMASGEVFFVATGEIDGRPAVLGFASDYAIEGARHGMSVYVRGGAARRGIGSALLRLAESHAISAGATSIEVEASLAGVEFYRANGFTELGRGETQLMSGHAIACVFMRKDTGSPEQHTLQSTAGMHIVVRNESPADWTRVEEVVREAFGSIDEARLVARLRSVDGILSLVAVVDGVVVGHTMFSPIKARGSTPALAAYGLAPVAVAADYQRRGVGTALITAGLAELRRRGAGLVVVLGHPSYYPRFGFVAASPLGLDCKWGGEDGAFQVLELVTGAAAAYRGTIDYDPVFDEFA